MTDIIHHQEAPAFDRPYGHDREFASGELDAATLRAYEPSLGFGPLGTRHYRRTVDARNTLHLRIRGDRATIHRDRVNPHNDLIGHLAHDLTAAHWLALGWATVAVVLLLSLFVATSEVQRYE